MLAEITNFDCTYSNVHELQFNFKVLNPSLASSQKILNMYILTSLKLYASSAEHSDILVGLLRANMIGRSLKAAISLIIPSVNACGTAAAPNNNQLLFMIVLFIKFLIFSM